MELSGTKPDTVMVSGLSMERGGGLAAYVYPSPDDILLALGLLHAAEN